jgi:hypothetical protein
MTYVLDNYLFVNTVIMCKIWNPHSGKYQTIELTNMFVQNVDTCYQITDIPEDCNLDWNIFSDCQLYQFGKKLNISETSSVSIIKGQSL